MNEKIKKNLMSYLVLLPITGVIVLLDQWTKAIVRSNLALGEVWSPFNWLTPYARIVHWYNTGVAFGMFQDRNLLILNSGFPHFTIHFYLLSQTD